AETWDIPFCILGSATGAPRPDAGPCPELSQTSQTLDQKFLFANRDGMGIYRTDYDEAGRKALLAPLRSLSLTAPERITLISDQQALALAGASLTPLLEELDALS